MKTTYTYNEGINFLRAVSILGIVLYHIFPFSVRGGYLGVCFFFLISGYLSAKNSELRWEAGGLRIRKYYIKKGIRIYPALYIMVMSVIAFFTIFHPELLLGAREEAASIFLGYNNWWQMMTQASYFMKITEHSPFTHLWYLGVEIELLIVWPLLYGIYKKQIEPRMGKQAFWFFAILAVASAVAMAVMYHPQNVNRVYYGTDTRAFSFLIGVVLGLKEDEWAQKKNILLQGDAGKALFIASLLVTVALFILVPGESDWLYRGGMAIISVYFAFIVYVMNQCGFSSMECSKNGVMQWIGKHSYWIYLWHYPILFIINLQHIF